MTKLNIHETVINISPMSVRNSEVDFGSQVLVQDHITIAIQSYNVLLGNISRIRMLPDEETSKTSVSSFVLKRIDYCKSTLTGSPSIIIDHMQKIARLDTLI